MRKMTYSQRGVSLSGLLIWVILLIAISIIAMKIIPSYIQNAEINSIFNEIVHDPEMQGASIKSIHESFNRRAMMNNITVINASDIEITKVPGGLILSASYVEQKPLFGNASLLLEFNPHSSAK